MLFTGNNELKNKEFKKMCVEHNFVSGYFSNYWHSM